MDNILDIYKNRRSIYKIGKNTDISKEKINKIIEQCVKYAPSAFNSQSSRVVVLYGKNNDIFWNYILYEIRKIDKNIDFNKIEEKFENFKSGIGTILFFEDENIIKNMEKNFSKYKNNFEIWSNQSNAMLQYMIWSAFYEKNIGASIQHYNELITKDIYKEFKIPEEWNIICQMPFGSIEEKAEYKEFNSLSERIKIFY